MKSEPLKIAFLVTNKYANEYIRDLIIKLKISDKFELSNLIIVETTEATSFVKAIHTLLVKILLGVERIFLFRNKNVVSQIIGQYALADLFKNVNYINQNDLIKNDLSKLNNVDVDLIIKIGDEIKDLYRLASLSKVGLISANFSPKENSLAILAGFWEVFYKEDTTVFSVVRILEAASEVSLLECCFQTRYCFMLNKAFLYKKAGVHFFEFLMRIAVKKSLDCEISVNLPLTKSKTLYQISISKIVIYFIKTMSIVFKKIFRTIFLDGFQWHVVIYNKSFSNSLIKEPRIIENPPGRFLADPFLIENEGRTYCFVEDCDYKTKRGKISVIEIFNDKFSDIKTCLEETFHLSFPYVFKYNESIYMCPETCDSDQIRIYKATNFPLEWKLEKVIMENIRAADSMLFEREGRWWMLTNIDPSRIGDNSSELYLFYADSPLSTEWTAHPLNPLVINSTKARNGGIVFEDNKIYRVAQMQAFDKYGAGISVFNIDKITANEYKENLFKTIEPNYLPDLLGTHHLSSTNNYMALDFYNLEK